jgi:hypothetical protein
MILRAALFLTAGMFIHAQVAAPAGGTSTLPTLDGKERMHEYMMSLIRPSAILSNILIAGYEEGVNFPHEWGRTGTSFGRRLGSQYAQYVLDNTIELGISALHHEDNRYQRIGDGTAFIRRFGNVVKSTVVVASTNGGHTIALGQIAGAYGSWAVASQTWEPPSEQKGSRILLWGSVNLAAKGGWNLIKEFGPDLHKQHPTSVIVPPVSHP